MGYAQVVHLTRVAVGNSVDNHAQCGDVPRGTPKVMHTLWICTVVFAMRGGETVDNHAQRGDVPRGTLEVIHTCA